MLEENHTLSTLSEDLKLEVWRNKEFSRMGFSPGQIMVLKRLDVTTHDVEDLINAGCPTDLALEILS